MSFFNFVKQGVREMAIARPDGNSDLIYKHPDKTVPRFAQVTVRADEWAVFAREGRPAGTLDAGRHSVMPGRQTRSSGSSQPLSASAFTFASGTGPCRSPLRA